MWARDSRVRILDCKGCQHSAKLDSNRETDLEAELADSLAVLTRLRRGSRRGQFDVLDTKVGESSGAVGEPLVKAE